ncbi:hypothetical protein CH333_03605 [candidate division WOR-3 bacterium JGI_Cruoil_03_44_89]|uniref:Putative zinc-finger domain-containing protein n=1 Tax=candidate division WOR-3 bacterium JGI_Cruoil_03_44_89 TaxID=1973748 RepID=A0A235BVD5_UNCW3|nr:MAG: hypothetical protein CH333_03605 [candidate division WOR-3 bacterium JGI_Cruoil_03_44_89]
MKCDEYKEDRILYVYGELRGERKRRFEEHLSSCPHCKKYIEDFRATLSLYEQLPNDEPSEKTVRRILKTSKRMHKPAPRRERSVFTWRLRWAIPALVGAVALFLVFLLPRSGGNRWEDNFEEVMDSMNQELCLLTEHENLNYYIDTQIEEIESELSELSEGW